MTQPDEIWAMVERRAVSSVRGVSADDNDALLQVALAEAPMNPHRQSSGAMASNGPGMMPPMMMGGGGGAGAGGSSGSGGLGTGPAAGSGGGAAGPTLATNATAPAGNLRETPYSAGGSSGGSSGGGVPSGSGASSSGGGSVPASGGTDDVVAAPDISEQPDVDEAPAPEPATGGTGGADSRVKPSDGFIADPQAVTGMATAWGDLRARLDRIDRAESEARLGLVEVAVRPQQAINDLIRMWLEGAGDEAGRMESKLRRAVKDYAAVDDDAIADIRRELPRD